MSVILEAKGLDRFVDLLRNADDNVSRAVLLATNDTAIYARARTSREIRQRINFRARYLTGGGERSARLAISKKATLSYPEAILTGRDRPTSLANPQFVRTQATFGRQKRPVRVHVGAGRGTQTLDRAFFVRLRRGSAAVTEENSNVGLAIRLRPGERLENKNEMASMGNGVYLLYGPSVGQAMRTVLPEEADDIGDLYGDRFIHQLERIMK